MMVSRTSALLVDITSQIITIATTTYHPHYSTTITTTVTTATTILTIIITITQYLTIPSWPGWYRGMRWLMCWFGKSVQSNAEYRKLRATATLEMALNRRQRMFMHFFQTIKYDAQTRLSDFQNCSGLLLLLLFLALDGITSPMQEKLFKEYGVSKSPDWQDWRSSLTSSHVFYFVHLWTSVRTQSVSYIMPFAFASVCWVCWSWKVQSDHVGQSVLSDCINHNSPEFRPRSDTNQTAW